LGAAIGRVGEELARSLGDGVVGSPETGRQVIVGTERDLPHIPDAALAVAVDADSLLLAPHYRAEEDAARILARVAATVVRGRGKRCLVQTAQPDHRTLTMLRGGHPLEFLRQLISERERDGLPPAASLLVVEVAGDATDRAEEIREVADDAVAVHGPEVGGDRTRWFLQGRGIEAGRIRLRSVVQRWRDAGLKVRIDADPIDL
jgi:primosomal protein N'